MFICTGNQCRSPFAENYARSRWGQRLVADSCGLLDLPPTPAAPETVIAAREVGVDLTHHRSTPIEAVDLRDIDLVLGFEHQHVAAAVVDHGAALEKTYLLTELPALLGPGAGILTLAEASDRRGILKRHGTPIEDPIGRPLPVHRRTVGQIVENCDLIFDALLGSREQKERPRGRSL